MIREIRFLRVAAVLWGIASYGSALSQNACTVNCGDKCTRFELGFQFRDPLCYSTCLTEQAACPITGGVTFPDFAKPITDVIRNACGLPNAVTLQYISSVCGFAVPDPLGVQKIEIAKRELITYGLVRAEEFNDVSIYFCDGIHGAGVVPDRDRVFLHTSARSASPKHLAGLLAHEMEHVRQYRVEGTDHFKCQYSRQVGDCLVSNIERGLLNLTRDGYCQTRTQNKFERQAYDAQDAAVLRLAQPPPQSTSGISGDGSHGSAGTRSLASTSGPGVEMYCQTSIGKNYCRTIAISEGNRCVCNRKLAPGSTGLTRAGGHTKLERPEGVSWD